MVLYQPAFDRLPLDSKGYNGFLYTAVTQELCLFNRSPSKVSTSALFKETFETVWIKKLAAAIFRGRFIPRQICNDEKELSKGVPSNLDQRVMLGYM